ncbi:MAG: CinA family nicotinamide mononucleotide deamidase-related protein [Bacteroidales bacterium]|nr:CinA family nicotinamide mononucleotide deamidase-related protein [Bacteroidales bacterium]
MATTASICTIGDEILIGQIVDTNSSKISQELNRLGIQVRYMFSIGDNRSEIISQLGRCLEETDIVIVTGGLGPTKDDITKDALKTLFGAEGYKESAEQMEIIVKILTARGIELMDINRAQAQVPNNCTVIPNRLGTAPCLSFHTEVRSDQFYADKEGHHKVSLYSLPGVPFEAIGLLPDIMEDIKKHFDLEEITHHTIETFGIPESTLAKMIEKWEDNLPSNIHLAYLPNPTIGVRLRLTQYGGKADFAKQIAELKDIIGDAIYGEGDDNLQKVIGDMLRQSGKTLSVAESCTGGRLSELITSVAGCSDYYKGSVTSYSNKVKINVLGVPAKIIDSCGAVSKECVIAMAEGVLKVLDTDFSVATSGVAGPGGGSAEKPVGMAHLAVAYRNPATGEISTTATVVKFASNRAVNIERFASNALNLLRLEIVKQLK